jgi:hypothetical protein
MLTAMNLDRLTLIKKTAIKAIFSDHELFQVMVLKGGNALDLVYHLAGRSSLDLDFSLADDFPPGQLDRIRDKIERALTDTFAPEGLQPFDVILESRPPTVTRDMADFWGGYTIQFKLIEKVEFQTPTHGIGDLRRRALVVGHRQIKTFRIDVSKHEYCVKKEQALLDGRSIQVYTLPMIVFEKLRAICQQMPEYAQIVAAPTRRGRGRDFFDIHTVLEARLFDPGSPENLELLKCIFAAKRVPIGWLRRIRDFREFHRADFESLQDTVKDLGGLRGYDFYFDYVVLAVGRLEPPRVE